MSPPQKISKSVHRQPRKRTFEAKKHQPKFNGRPLLIIFPESLGRVYYFCADYTHDALLQQSVGSEWDMSEWEKVYLLLNLMHLLLLLLCWSLLTLQRANSYYYHRWWLFLYPEEASINCGLPGYTYIIMAIPSIIIFIVPFGVLEKNPRARGSTLYDRPPLSTCSIKYNFVAC